MKKRIFLAFYDGMAVFFSFLAGYYMRFYTGLFEKVETPPISFYITANLAAVFIYIFVMAYLGTYKKRLFPNFTKELSSLIQASFWSAVILTAGTFFYRGFLYSRIAMGFSFIFVFITLVALHYIFARMEQSGIKRALVIGQGEHIETLLKRLKRYNPSRIHISYLPCFKADQAEEIIHCINIDMIIASPSNYRENLSVVKFADSQNKDLYLVPGMHQFLYSGEIDDMDGLPFIFTGRTPVERFPAPLIKRASDIIIGSALFYLFIILLPLMAIAIKTDSRGPLFFRQTRVGKDGRRFKIFKFRTMKNNTAEGETVPYTMKEDIRVTRTGRLMRRYNIDELPQILNIANGEMSLVGPRPISAEDTFFLKHDYFQFRLRVKPGLTGWAQIHGLRGGHAEPAERFQYDLYYIENWSIWLDLAIILSSPFSFRNAF